MGPGGYAWWYVDALSDDGRFGLTIIAFIGSVFSPYYAWSGRGDPLNHCAINVALYGPGHRWAMTERGRDAVRRDERRLSIGPSALNWDGRGLTVDVNEIAVPFPARLRGSVRVEPTCVNDEVFTLDARGGHIWRPIAPAARVSLDFSSPGLRWSGGGYFDMNAGDEPLEAGFKTWTWSRAALPDGAAILYDAERRVGDPLALALRFGADGRAERLPPPPVAALPKTRWRVARSTRSDGEASVLRGFEDTPFYSRSLVASTLFGQRIESMHESLMLDRVAHPLVRLMLPFRMPRRPAF